jgi:hypothetical protein
MGMNTIEIQFRRRNEERRVERRMKRDRADSEEYGFDQQAGRVMLGRDNPVAR